MSSYQGEIFNAFFNTEHGKGLLKTAQEKGPTEEEIKKAHPAGGEDTEVSKPGVVSDEYSVPQEAIDGDGHVETVEEVAPVIEDIARKESTGVEGSTIKSFTKTSKKKPDFLDVDKDGDKKESMEKAEKDKKKDKKDEKKDDKKDEKKDKKEDNKDKMKAMRDKKGAFVSDLLKIADNLDELGLTEEASMIDEIVQAESGLSIEAFFHPDHFHSDQKSPLKAEAQSATSGIPKGGEIMSIVGMSGGNLSKIDELFKDLPSGLLQKLKHDLVDYLEQKIEMDYEHRDDVGAEEVFGSSNWKEQFHNFVKEEEMIEGTVFEKLLFDRLSQRFTKGDHEVIRDAMPGEIPSNEDLEQWYRESALRRKKILTGKK